MSPPRAGDLTAGLESLGAPTVRQWDPPPGAAAVQKVTGPVFTISYNG